MVGALPGEVTLALPCRLITVRVQLGTSRFTPVQEVVLSAILHGRSTFRAIGEFLGLPHRLVIDLVTELWVDGKLVVDQTEGRISLAPTTRDLMAATEPDTAVTSKTERWQVAYEPISGRMVPVARTTRRTPAGDLLALPLVHGRDETDLPASELIRAIQAVADDRLGEGRSDQVRAVGFGSPELAGSSELRWLQVRATVRTDGDSGRVHADLHTEPLLASAGRRRVATHIAELADELPDLPFVQQLKARCQQSLVAGAGLRTYVDELMAKSRDLEGTEPNQVALKHGELEGLASRAWQALRRQEERKMAATPLYGVAEHRSAVIDMLERARRQVVLGGPRLSYAALAEILGPVEDALGRGVQVAFLVGAVPHSPPPAKVVTALSDLKTRFVDRLVWSPKPAVSNARFAVEDDRQALITCSDLLGLPADTRRPSHEPGLLLTALTDSPQPVVEDILVFARSRFPDYLVGQSILAIHEHFGSSEGTPDSVAPDGSDPATPRLPDVRGGADARTVELWARSWASYVDGLARRSARVNTGGPSVEVLTGNEHIDALWSAVRATGPLAVASESVNVQALSDNLLDALPERVGQTAIRYTKVDRASPEAPATLSAASAQVQQIGSPARVLLSGASAVVTSFDFLSVPRHGRPGVRRPAELGVQVVDRALVHDLAIRLDVPYRLAAEEPAPEGPLLPLEVLDVLVEAGADGPASFGPRLVEILPDIDDPWSLLAEWESVVSDDELHTAAAVMCRHAAGPAERRAHWLEYLVESAWRRRSFVEAAVLAGHGDYAPSRIQPVQAVAAAAIDVGPLAELWVNVAIEASDLLAADACGVVAMGALTEIARLGVDGDVSGATVCVEEHAGDLPDGWRCFAGLVLDYRSRHAAPLPLDIIEDLIELDRQKQDAQRRWDEIAATMQRLAASQRMLNFTPGTALHSELFSGHGLGTRLARAAAGDPDERASLAGDLPGKVRPALDAIVAGKGAEPIAWSRHLPYLHDFESAVVQARRLLRAETTGAAADGDADQQLAAITWLVDNVRVPDGARLDDLLLTEARKLPEPIQWPALAVYELFAPLLRQLQIRGAHG